MKKSGYIVWDDIEGSIKSSMVHTNPEDAERVANRLNRDLDEERYAVRFIEIY